MKFEEVLPYLRNGYLIYKKNWKDKDFYLSLKDKKSNDCAILSLNEIMEDDWKFRDDRKYMGFGEAFELMKKGHKIRHKAWDNKAYAYITKDLRPKIMGHCIRFVWEEGFGEPTFCLDESEMLDNNWYVVE